MFNRVKKDAVRANMRAEILPDSEMKALGFIKYDDSYWMYRKPLNDTISLNVVIPLSEERPYEQIYDELTLESYEIHEFFSTCNHTREMERVVKDTLNKLKKNNVIATMS